MQRVALETGPSPRFSPGHRCGSPGHPSVTGVTIFLSGRVARRISRNTMLLLARIAGILLTAIAVTLLVSGGTRMVHSLLATLT